MMDEETKEEFFDSFLLFVRDIVGRAKYRTETKNIYRKASQQAQWMEEKILFHKNDTELASVFHAYERWRRKLAKYGPGDRAQKKFCKILKATDEYFEEHGYDVEETIQESSPPMNVSDFENSDDEEEYNDTMEPCRKAAVITTPINIWQEATPQSQPAQLINIPSPVTLPPVDKQLLENRSNIGPDFIGETENPNSQDGCKGNDALKDNTTEESFENNEEKEKLKKSFPVDREVHKNKIVEGSDKCSTRAKTYDVSENLPTAGEKEVSSFQLTAIKKKSKKKDVLRVVVKVIKKKAAIAKKVDVKKHGAKSVTIKNVDLNHKVNKISMKHENGQDEAQLQLNPSLPKLIFPEIFVRCLQAAIYDPGG